MIHRHEFHAMGSRMVGLVESDEAPAALEELPAGFEVWEQSLSRFRNDSELCELNRRAGSVVRVSETLWDVFLASRQAEQQTGGLVNPLILDALRRSGYDRSFDLLERDALAAGRSLVMEAVPALSEVEILPLERALRLPAGTELDFGGVAKGWAAQQAMLKLRAYGPALFSAGGDIAISGPRARAEPWGIDVDDPFRPGLFVETLYLTAGGVATSGRDYRTWKRAGAQQHHIIDPRTGQPAQTDVLTATVIAPDALRAEALAKAILIVGSEAGLAWLDGDEDLAGLLILEDGRRVDSRNLERYL